ncbi:NCS1 nucleoside transporter [Gymnopus androsaceus JB14]|uniref:NCS1 nucleoside transporter n=1 Tax=Gymnopus androsaceus JB14 TaxID=1447944 RepID=A0A6A4IC39_9AGAR|nr:NCS1 nucleoside transporter [Gymnopus androsaceus JB14]
MESESVQSRVLGPFRSRQAFIKAVKAPGAEAFDGQHIWSNKDLDPTPLSERNWRWYHYVSLWWGSSFNPNDWSTGSSLLSIGLSFGNAMGTVAMGALLSSIAIVFAARSGSRYHIGYPVTIRASMGMYGGYFFIALRSLIAMIYYGIQSYYAGNLFSVMFRCMFGHKWTNLAPFPISANISSQSFVGFMIFYAFTFPLMFIHPRSIHVIFFWKAILLPPCAIALTAWAVTQAGGISTFSLGTSGVSGSQLGWAWMDGINTILSSISPLIVSQPDITRYARSPFDASYPQAFANLFVKVLVYFLAICTAASLQVLYGGTPTWNLWDQLNLILDHNWNAGSRTLCFLMALAFSAATALTNISANSIPFAADVTGLLPRWMTIRRGQVLCALLGLAITPWNFLQNAQQFLTFLGSYNMFMGALLAVIWSDYFLVRKSNFHIPSLYSSDPKGPYWYWRGINWRGVLAWICGSFIPFPGLIGSYNAKLVDESAIRMFQSGWLISIAISFVVYYVLCTIFPVPIYPPEYAKQPVTRGFLAKQEFPGVFPDENWRPLSSPDTEFGRRSSEFSENQKSDKAASLELENELKKQ